jgi:hypothetical protein
MGTHEVRNKARQTETYTYTGLHQEPRKVQRLLAETCRTLWRTTELVLTFLYICQMINENTTTIATGVIGAGAVEVTNVLMTNIPSPEEVSTVGQLIIQLVIGIVTVWRIIKKPKK